ncbi:ABC transporter permease subunit [Granulosicoccus sp.]|nr:ABC transporter permease subunit [Granulosicoccus sp.]MDB4222166.1 ABC transporter permease subunit [Granulosicoccus sp.]
MLNLFRNRKFREALLQAAVVSGAAVLIIAMVINARATLDAQGLTTGYGFLKRSTGWDFSFSVLPYTISDTYSRTILIGILNTLLLGFLGIFFATIIGTIIGLIRTSKNHVFSFIGTVYVETFRNVPLILQAVFWYSIVSHFPKPRSAISLGDTVFLTGRGLYFPGINVNGLAVIAIVILFIVWMLMLPTFKRMMDRPSNYYQFKLLGWIVLVLIALAIAYAARIPNTPLIDMPALKGLNFKGGVRMTPELSALVIAISLYGGAYIGEVVRAGLMSVPRGQIEAGFVNGLSNYHIFSRIRFPLAIRAVLPSLTNQYVQLMKATTIGLVVGFSDFFMIISTSINQSGQTLELLSILMGGFLLINLSIAFVMNTINSKIAIKEQGASS